MIRLTELFCYCAAASLLAIAAVRGLSPEQWSPGRSAEPIALRTIEASLRNGEATQTHQWSRSLFSVSATDTTDVTGTLGTRSGAGPPQAPTLLGIMMDENHKMALVRYDGSLLRVQEAQSVGQWTVLKIERRAALLRHGDVERRVFLDPPSHKQ